MRCIEVHSCHREVLEHRIRELSLRSVINLRTSERGTSWLKAEQEVTEVHGVDFHLIRLSVFMPPRATLQQLVRLLDTARRPLLLHCEMGVERSGIASAVVVLLAGGNIAEARKQFGLTYGFVPLICHPDLLKVLDDYGHWLAVRGWSHTPERFRRWVENDYVPYFYRARLEPLDVPASIVQGQRGADAFSSHEHEPTALEVPFRSPPGCSPRCKSSVVRAERKAGVRIAWRLPKSHRCTGRISSVRNRDSSYSRIWTLQIPCGSRRRACEVVLGYGFGAHYIRASR